MTFLGDSKQLTECNWNLIDIFHLSNDSQQSDLQIRRHSETGFNIEVSFERKSPTLSLLITDSDFVVVSGSDLVFAQEFCLFA